MLDLGWECISQQRNTCWIWGGSKSLNGGVHVGAGMWNKCLNGGVHVGAGMWNKCRNGGVHVGAGGGWGLKLFCETLRLWFYATWVILPSCTISPHSSVRTVYVLCLIALQLPVYWPSSSVARMAAISSPPGKKIIILRNTLFRGTYLCPLNLSYKSYYLKLLCSGTDFQF